MNALCYICDEVILLIPDDKIRVQLTLRKDLLALVEKQADKDDRNLSNFITVVLKEYLEKH